MSDSSVKLFVFFLQIECAGIATHAKKIVAENGLAEKITIIHGKVEDIVLPVESVDVIISEWMGYFLIYESMLDTVLYARDKWLDKDSGVMMPDQGRMFVTSIEDADYKSEKIEFWDDVWGFKMTSLKEEAMKEPLVDLCPARAICSDDCQILVCFTLRLTVGLLVPALWWDKLHAFFCFCVTFRAFFWVAL